MTPVKPHREMSLTSHIEVKVTLLIDLDTIDSFNYLPCVKKDKQGQSRKRYRWKKFLVWTADALFL